MGSALKVKAFQPAHNYFKGFSSNVEKQIYGLRRELNINAYMCVHIVPAIIPAGALTDATKAAQ